jgi:VIT1/CCC1 family predicted Fe2+/Mn2+ transporter
VIYLSAGAGALILFLFMAYGVLAFIAQPVVFGVALFIVLILLALSWMKSGKRRL